METVLRGVTIYVVLLAVMRLSGRRTLAQATPFDFILLLIIAATTQQALLGDDFSITNAVILIITLFGLDVFMSYVKRWSPGISALVDGNPVVLISQGRPDDEAMLRARVDLADVMEAARRQHGLKRLDQIDFAVLEVSGGLSIIPAKGSP